MGTNITKWEPEVPCRRPQIQVEMRVKINPETKALLIAFLTKSATTVVNISQTGKPLSPEDSYYIFESQMCKESFWELQFIDDRELADDEPHLGIEYLNILYGGCKPAFLQDDVIVVDVVPGLLPAAIQKMYVALPLYKDVNLNMYMDIILIEGADDNAPFLSPRDNSL